MTSQPRKIDQLRIFTWNTGGDDTQSSSPANTPSYNNTAIAEGFLNDHPPEDLQYGDSVSEQPAEGFPNEIPSDHPVEDLQYDDSVSEQPAEGFPNETSSSAAFGNNETDEAYSEPMFDMEDDVSMASPQASPQDHDEEHGYGDTATGSGRDADVGDADSDEDGGSSDNTGSGYEEDLFIVFDPPNAE